MQMVAAVLCLSITLHPLKNAVVIKNKSMSINEIKLYIINGSTLGVTTFMGIEDWLKIILLLITIGYTISKWATLKKKK